MIRATTRSVTAFLLALHCAFLISCKKPDQSNSPHQSEASNPPKVENTEPSPPLPAVPCKFEWLDSKQQASTWSEVTAAFHQELIPDTPAADAYQSADAYTRKQITRMARCGDAALVILEKSTDIKDQQDWNRLFELYNFNLTTKAKSAIEAKWPFLVMEIPSTGAFRGWPSPRHYIRSPELHRM